VADAYGVGKERKRRSVATAKLLRKEEFKSGAEVVKVKVNELMQSEVEARWNWDAGLPAAPAAAGGGGGPGLKSHGLALLRWFAAEECRPVFLGRPLEN
jgi:hypothetical protein